MFLGSSNRLPLPVIDYHRTGPCNRLQQVVIDYQRVCSDESYTCNRLPRAVIDYSSSLSINTAFFSLLAQLFSPSLSLTAPLLLKTSNHHNFLVSCPNHFKQRSNFFFLNSLQRPSIRICINKLKWKNPQRKERDYPLPPSLQANAATTHLVTHQHQIFLLFHLLGH